MFKIYFNDSNLFKRNPLKRSDCHGKIKVSWKHYGARNNCEVLFRTKELKSRLWSAISLLLPSESLISPFLLNIFLIVGKKIKSSSPLHPTPPASFFYSFTSKLFQRPVWGFRRATPRCISVVCGLYTWNIFN